MEIKNRKRGGMQGRTSSFNEKKARYNFDLSILNLMCSYILSQNANIRRGNLINMRNLFDSIDLSIYDKDPEKMKRINFIRRGLEARLIQDLKNPTLILTYINGGIVNTNLDNNEFDEISNNELEFIDQTISGALKNTFIDSDMDKFFDLYTRYKAEEYRYRDAITAEIEMFVAELHNKFRRAKTEEISNTSFSLKEGEFENSLSDIHDSLTAPGRYLYCTMQGVNTLVGGGFECTRAYLFLGMAGIGKSMLLLNLALQMKKANKGYIPKDPTKIPTILFLTQENSVEETVDRICNIITGKNIKEFGKEELINILRTEGELMLEGDNNININIIYKPDRSIDTGDLYTIIEDLEDDGYEVIALFQDHIKRIRSIDRHVSGDVRLELGFVMNELKILAQLKKIPVITVSHLNRDASKTIDSMVQGNKTDLTRLLGRSNIGESMLMYDNADCVVIANREIDIDEVDHLVLKNVKLRNGSTKLDYICQPFERGSGTKLVEDLYDVMPRFKITLVPETQQAPTNTMEIKGIVMKQSSYTNLNNINKVDEVNIFNSLQGAKYSSDILAQPVQQPIQPKKFIVWENKQGIAV